ncbi:hypothetical protein CEUSTIGMA_g810.t1 [Chlamydomonas eustigma]|uniref:PAS domain-containing protein n=1 Tax=Chlamydomonas eustigma TaxID=1157962 RepID=A0A250WR92_9CHLO|nr:hypothetical protein CEUSTIGMA_g810.t1 [Chlamydomonas eustigma]|eukprot:GAX73357.1 hypothetical protein CEUSTIGMA_g810.t1 [Chlamydomonas eustigma]
MSRDQNDHDDMEEEKNENEKATMLKGIFGVIYTVSRERIVTWKFVAFKIIFDVWQLLTLVINPQYGWYFDGSQMWWQVLDFVQLNYFMTARGVTFYLVCLYIFAALVFFTLALCIWVAWSFKNQQFDYVWPITFLRLFGVVFFQMLDIASMTMFLMALDCRYFGTEYLGYNQEFSSNYCWEFPFFINSAVGALSLVIFVGLSVVFQMGEMELNMVTTNMLGMAHSKAEVISFMLKFLVTSASVFLNSLEWLSIFYLSCFFLLLYISLKWEPFYYAWVNHARVAVNSGVFYCSMVLVVLVYAPMVNTSDPVALGRYQMSCTIALIVGMLPAAAAGWFLSVWRLRHIEWIVNKFRKAQHGIKSKFIHKFWDARQVEMCARCCRKWVEEDVLDEDAVELAQKILEAGMEQLPGDAFMIILYSSFLMDVKGGSQSGLAELAAIKRADMSLLESFALYSREQLNIQRTSGATGSQGADLIAYVEQQRSYRMAMMVNKDAFQAASEFWAALMKSQVQLSDLTRRVKVLDKSVEEATKAYRQLLQRSPDNWRLLQMYAVFLEMIRNDPWNASKVYTEAERLQTAEEEAQRNAFLTQSAMVGASTLARGSDESSVGVIIMNAKCLIQTANKAICDLAGYTPKELVGKNVNVLIPRPFSDQHDQFVLKHIRSGVKTIIDENTELVMLHKNRYVIGIDLLVTKLSGFGMDSVFMGSIRAIPTPQGAARLWALSNGVVLSVDITFSDWFGYQPEDLPGMYLSSIVKDPATLEEVFRRKKVTLGAPYTSGRGDERERRKMSEKGDHVDHGEKGVSFIGSTCGFSTGMELKNIYIKHKYASAVKCGLRFENGAENTKHELFVITIRREENRPILVSDSKGKLLHVSKVIADDLGVSVVDLLEDLSENIWDVLLPEPFGQLHNFFASSELPAFYPAFSCRSGVTVILNGQTDEGPVPKPYRLQVKPRKLEKLGEAVNIVQLLPSTMEKAMDERRLSLVMDQSGNITKVGGSPSALFGFDPPTMLGMPVSTYIDVFQMRGASEVDAAEHYHKLLVELAVRALEDPGESYRVGVTATMRAGQTGALMGAVAMHMHSKGTHPAVMQVKVHLGNEEAAQGVQSHQLETRKLETKTSNSIRNLPTKINCKSSLDFVNALMEGGRRSRVSRIQTPPLSTRGVVADLQDEVTDFGYGKKRSYTGEVDVAEVAEEQGMPGLNLEISLWRADSMTGLIYIDKAGRITRTSDLPLFQPGLLLGVSDEKLVGTHIGDVMPAMVGRPVSHLFLSNLGQGPKSSVMKKGGLKTRIGYDEEQVKPGPVNVMTTNHFVDNLPLSLSAQAVPAKGYKKEVCLVLHLNKPSTGCRDFIDVLKANSQGVLRFNPDLTPKQNTRRMSVRYGPAAARRMLREVTVKLRSKDPEEAATAQLFGLKPDSDQSDGKRGKQSVNFAAALMSLEEVEEELSNLKEETLPAVAEDSSDASDSEAGNGVLPRGSSGESNTVSKAASWVMSDGLTPVADINKDERPARREAMGLTPEMHPLAPISAFEYKAASAGPDRDDYQTLADLGTLDGGGAGNPIAGVEGSEQEPKAEEKGNKAAAGTTSESSMPDADFRRGRRFKKIVKLLTSEIAMYAISAFLYQALACMVFVVAVSVICFVVVMLLLNQQTMGVNTINNIGNVGVAIGEINNRVVSLAILVDGNGVKGLVGPPALQSAEDIPAMLSSMAISISNLKQSLDAAYFSVIEMADPLVLEVWNTPTINISVYYDAIPPAVGTTFQITNYSLWDAGNIFLGCAQNVLQNTYYRNQTTLGSDPFDDWSYAKFIENNVLTLYTAIYSSLNIVVLDVVNQALSVNQVQLMITVVQGFAACFFVTLYMYFLNMKMTRIRHHLYSPFMLVPVSVIRGMVKIDLDSVTNDFTGGKLAKDDEVGEPMTMKLSLGPGMSGALNTQSEGVWALVQRSLSFLVFWRQNSNRVSPIGVSSRRQLVISPRKAVIMCLPYIAWGIITVAVGFSAHSLLSKIPAPIALFNIVNFVDMMYTRYFGVVTQMTAATEPEKGLLKQSLLAAFQMPTEYTAMVYGGSAVTGATSPHYTLATEGVADAGGMGKQILYQTTACLRTNISTCLLHNSTLYQDATNGFDRLIKVSIQSMKDTLTMNASFPTLNQPDFYTMWNLRPDVKGGLAILNTIYYEYVTSFYASVLTVQIVGLVLSLLLMIIFYFFMLRPYVTELKSCRRRLAHLLSTLPNEVDVEGLVKRAVAAAVGGVPSTVSAGGITASGPSSSAALSSQHGSNKSFA